MRSVMFSMTIIMFCLSMGVINTVNADYMMETNRTLYGGGEVAAFTPMLDRTDLKDVQDVSSFNNTIRQISKTDQNPLTQTIESVYALFTLLYKFAMFFINTLILSTIGFGGFIQTLGGGTQYTFIPDYLANLLTVGVCINHLFAVGQLYMNWSVKNAA